MLVLKESFLRPLKKNLSGLLQTAEDILTKTDFKSYCIIRYSSEYVKGLIMHQFFYSNIFAYLRFFLVFQFPL